MGNRHVYVAVYEDSKYVVEPYLDAAALGCPDRWQSDDGGEIWYDRWWRRVSPDDYLAEDAPFGQSDILLSGGPRDGMIVSCGLHRPDNTAGCKWIAPLYEVATNAGTISSTGPAIPADEWEKMYESCQCGGTAAHDTPDAADAEAAAWLKKQQNWSDVCGPRL